MEALAALEVALSLIPEHEKSDYLKALEVAPDLIFRESDPIKFLRFAGFNPPAAALALIRYWKGRREAFGDDAFLPLTLTGNGALNENVLDMIRSGVSITPICDKSGRSVLFYDTSRRIFEDFGLRHRYVFYVHQYLMENELSQTEGYVLVTLGDLTFDVVNYKTLSKITNTFPVKLKAWHLLGYVPNQRSQREISSPLRKFLVESYCRLHRGHSVHVHDICSRDGSAKALATHNIDRSMIPMALGGDWSYWQVQEWFEWRKQKDKEHYGSFQPHGKVSIAGCKAQNVDPLRLPLKKRAKIYGALCSKGHVETIEAINHDKVNEKVSLIQELSVRQALIKFREDQGKARTIDESGDVARKIDVTDVAKYFCRQVNRAFQRVPLTASAAYMAACSEAPAKVWEEESNLVLFLITEDFHVSFAARRLARYWDLRLDVFRDKKYLAMTQTGEGTLQRRTDLSLLDAGFVQLLPHDDEGCSVVFIDTTCLNGTNLTARVNRCLFYMFSLATENVKSQRHGVSVIIKTTGKGKFLLGGVDLGFLERISDSLPLKIKAFHILNDTVEPHTHFECNLANDNALYVHHVRSKEEGYRTLKGFGFRTDGLPRCVNGTWGTSQFTLWQELRARVEWNIPLGLSGRDVQNFPAIKPYDIHEDKVERGRRLSAIHSRRKRGRKRIEQGILEDQVADSDEINKRLRKENEKLECLIRRARLLLQDTNTPLC